ncbi:50S ribosomal protein L16 [Sedimentisphaera cyanobacteriorum]|uniref:Large ribosomal subunit protein uL16 n=1 Tax=Sedimentisphaera cyanobacteriorum TaxID=1940790 RepID=A0A1Q2HQ59_9BACT|nr:50S ribosomal protein L16 [Sedimentisphaera cyanobacteriorum]AQQ09424.1 50S ribosomal protein L16 [Sedimentisphaera cyanobacteriorum]
MALMPKRVKYRKQQRGKNRGNATRNNTVAFGEYGIQSLEHSWITARQIEAGRIAATHYLRRQGTIHIRIFPHKSFTSTPLETRMGKGKGDIEGWVAVVKPGTVMFEISGVDEKLARAALARVAQKMPVRCRFTQRKHSMA